MLEFYNIMLKFYSFVAGSGRKTI